MIHSTIRVFGIAVSCLTGCDGFVSSVFLFLFLGREEGSLLYVTCRLIEPKESTKEEMNKSAIAIGGFN